jgi:hypothetical protein
MRGSGASAPMRSGLCFGDKGLRQSGPLERSHCHPRRLQLHESPQASSLYSRSRFDSAGGLLARARVHESGRTACPRSGSHCHPRQTRDHVAWPGRSRREACGHHAQPRLCWLREENLEPSDVSAKAGPVRGLPSGDHGSLHPTFHRRCRSARDGQGCDEPCHELRNSEVSQRNQSTSDARSDTRSPAGSRRCPPSKPAVRPSPPSYSETIASLSRGIAPNAGSSRPTEHRRLP